MTLLISSLAQNTQPISLAAEYMRWSRRTIGAAFLGSITAATYVRADARSDDPFYVDRVVQLVHPFIKYWQDEG